jgi:hypothetical protein
MVQCNNMAYNDARFADKSLECTMTEYGDIFDYNQSAIAFEALSLAFMAAYGLLIVWVASHIENPVADSLLST